ncbi:MAG: putative DNA binding domain-containing protein [Bacteroidetes bacterium]|nr:putative DNA binding domain-containing protein [Bacteroidota bacterium]
MSILINIEDLLSGKVVEGTRVEFKVGWNPPPIMRSVCAFANDFENEGSGYIIIGVKEKSGKPIRPVVGFDPNLLEKVEKELIGYCNLIKPSFFPRLSMETVDGKHILVIWVPAGSNRPYKVPDDVTAKNKTFNYRIRYRSNSIVPNEEQETELIQLTAKIPFDDRLNTFASVDDLSYIIMREHLAKTKSKLYEESGPMNTRELAERMNLCQGADEHLFPKNVGLLMFSEDPERYFKGIRIDLVEFPQGLSSKKFDEQSFTGPIQKQLSDVLAHIKKYILKTKVIKYADKEESDRVLNYPFPAIEEALSNAVYHRNYELQDPIEVRILPESIEIISYNGVDPSLKQKDFDKGLVRARRYRNRRVGEFLKELHLTEGRGTGIPTIFNELEKNGSPKPIFDTNDPERSFFVVVIPIHNAFINQDNIIENQVSWKISDQVTDQVSFTKMLEKTSNLLEIASLTAKLSPSEWDQVRDQVRDQAESINKHIITILNYCVIPRNRKDICEKLGLTNKDSNFKRYAGEALELEWIQMTSKERSSKQTYIITNDGMRLI